MAIAHDQTGTLADVGFGATGVITFSTAPAAGATVLVFAAADETVSSVADNGATPATFTRDKLGTGDAVPTIWRGENITLPATGQYKVTVTFASAASALCAGASFTGMKSGAPDGTNSGTGAGATVATGNVTPAAAGSLVFGGFADDASAAETITLATSGAVSIASSPAADGFCGAAAYNIPSGTAAQGLAWTHSAVDWFAAVAVYGPAGGVSHEASASLSVTPSFTATQERTQSASLTVTLAFSASASSGPPTFAASAALTVTPTFSAAASPTRNLSASLTVTPAFTASPHAEHVASASLTVTPAFSASPHAVHKPTASLTVTPSLTAAATKDAGAPPGYPDGDLDAKIELLLDGTWTDITTAALPDGQQYGSIRSGQPDGAQQPSPASMNAIWDNPDYSLSPRNASGPYFGQLRQNTPARVSFTSPYGGYLRLEADNEDMASVADTAALHVTGSIELRIEVLLSDYRACTLTARNDGTTTSWAFAMNDDGTLFFEWRDSGGTLHTVTSGASPAVTWRAFRCTMDASDGTVAFYVSDGIDGTWTQLGDAASGTSGAATSIRAGNSPLVTGWSAAVSRQMRGQVSGLRVYDGLADDDGTIVADAAFSIQVPGITTWTDLAGLTWTLSGGAELTARDYRLHGELSSLAPTAQPSGNVARVQAAVSGRLRRLQQGSAPTAESAIRRAILAQTGDLFPVGYWTMEDGAGSGIGVFSRTFGPAAGAGLMTAELGKVQPAADSSFEASAALPVLNGDQLSVTVDTYSGATAWAVRFLLKLGQLPASGDTAVLASVSLASGTVRRVDVSIDDTGAPQLIGVNSSGGNVFSTSHFGGFDLQNPKWFSIEAVKSGSNTIFNAISLAPGATTGEQLGGTLPSVSGSPANVSSVAVNPSLFFTDTVVGHLSVQKAWTTMFALGDPLNAWRTELADKRFARVCAENGITARIIGRSVVTQAMGPQPRGSVWTILQDCVQTEQGLLFEPAGCFGLGFRTRESLGAQAAGLTLSFADASLRGDLQPVDDDSGFLNDVTGSTPGGTSWRVTLDDGSATSVSEPEDGGMGRYAGQVPFPLNVADDGELQSAVAFYLGRVSADEPRYRNVIGDLGIPGAPVKDIARLRPGDLIKITDVPEIYQTDDIQQLAMSATETFGPGRKIAWDCVPWAPYSS